MGLRISRVEIIAEQLTQDAMQRDHYTVLGVSRDAAPSDIQAAYRRLARIWHPDVNNNDSAVAIFKTINEAYSVLGNDHKRAAYDDTLNLAANVDVVQSSHPTFCSECGRFTAQPRILTFRTSVGLGVWNHVGHAEGIYCSRCARKVGLNASVVSAVVGWWAVPFGPVVTAWCIMANAFCGGGPRQRDRRLALLNAQVFLDRGNFNLARALAQKALEGADKAAAAKARRIIERASFGRDDGAAIALRDPWQIRPLYLGAHVLLLLVPPAAVIAVVASLLPR